MADKPEDTKPTNPFDKSKGGDSSLPPKAGKGQNAKGELNKDPSGVQDRLGAGQNAKGDLNKDPSGEKDRLGEAHNAEGDSLPHKAGKGQNAEGELNKDLLGVQDRLSKGHNTGDDLNKDPSGEKDRLSEGHNAKGELNKDPLGEKDRLSEGQNNFAEAKKVLTPLQVVELYQRRDKVFEESVESVLSSINCVQIENRDNGQVAMVDVPYQIQKNDSLEMRIACFPYVHYVTKMYLCGLLDDEQASEAMEIEQRLLEVAAESMSVGDVVDVSTCASPYHVLSKLSEPLPEEVITDYLRRTNRIAMVASLIDLNNKNIYNNKVDVSNYLPRQHILSHAPDEIVGCCQMLEELIMIRNDLRHVSGKTGALLSRCVVDLYVHEVGEMLKDVPENPSNPGVKDRAYYMNVYFQALIRQPETRYDNQLFPENLLRAIQSVRGDIKINHFESVGANLDLSAIGDENKPWKKTFLAAFDKTFEDAKKMYGIELSALRQSCKITSQNPGSRNLKNQGHSRAQ